MLLNPNFSLSSPNSLLNQLMAKEMADDVCSPAIKIKMHSLGCITEIVYAFCVPQTHRSYHELVLTSMHGHVIQARGPRSY